MSKSSLILFEKSGAWAAALRAIAPPNVASIVETRSLPAAVEALAHADASVVAFEVTTETLSSALTFLLTQAGRHPQARFVGLLGADHAACEVVLREAGAIDCMRSVLELPRLSQLADRQAARMPRVEPTIGEWTFARMPWKALATSPAAIHP